MMFSMILAMAKDNLIGKTDSQFGLPWDYPEDLQFYKEKTIGKVNVMGRTTFNKIGKPLPGRQTIVLSRNRELIIDGVVVLNNVEQLLAWIQEQKEQGNTYLKTEEIMIVGGPEIFELLFEQIETIYLTRINKDFTGDVYYQKFSLDEFEMTTFRSGNNEDLRFETWKRKLK